MNIKIKEILDKKKRKNSKRNPDRPTRMVWSAREHRRLYK